MAEEKITKYGPGEWPKEWEHKIIYAGKEYTVVSAPFFQGTSNRGILAVISSRELPKVGQPHDVLKLMLMGAAPGKTLHEKEVEALEQIGVLPGSYRLLSKEVEGNITTIRIMMTEHYSESLLAYREKIEEEADDVTK